MSVMFGLDFGEMLLLGAIALIALGPKQLPEVARTVGKFINEMKRITGDFTKTVVDARDQTNEKLVTEEELRRTPALIPPDSTVPAAPLTALSPTHQTSSDVAEEQLSFDLKKDS